MSMKRSAQVTLAVLVGLGALLPLADAQTGFRMPRALVWTAYDVGSAGYSQAASIGHVMQQKEGVTLRVIPAGNDVARQIPLVRRTAQFGALGNAFFLSQEGVMDFAAPEWGPQQVRIIAAAWADFNTGVASCAADAGIKTVFDFKGKRIAWVVGAPALNLNMTAYLAAAGLGWSDVQKLDFPSWGASGRAVIEGKADCWIASTNSGPVYELATQVLARRDAGSEEGSRGLGAPEEGGAVHGGERRQHRHGADLQGHAPHGRHLRLPDHHDVRLPGRRARVPADADDLRAVPGVQGRLARQRGLRARRAAAQVGRAVPRGRRPLLQGKEGLDGGARASQPRPRAPPGGPRAGLGPRPGRGAEAEARRGQAARAVYEDPHRGAAEGGARAVLGDEVLVGLDG